MVSLMLVGNAETVAMVNGLIARAEEAMIAYLNEAAQEIYDRSQVEVPKSESHELRPHRPDYPAKPLKDTGEVIEATPEKLEARVVYNSPYATAQHEGHMTYERHGKEVDWVVEHYTTAGTKKKYLEDPAKAVAARGAEELAAQGRLVMGEIP